MAFFTADICDDHSDRAAVWGPGYRNYGGADKCQGEIITIKLDTNNSDLISLLATRTAPAKSWWSTSIRPTYAVVGENLMNFAQQNNYSGIVVNGYVRDTSQIKEHSRRPLCTRHLPSQIHPCTAGRRDIALSLEDCSSKWRLPLRRHRWRHRMPERAG